jgi:hypothetical protein
MVMSNVPPNDEEYRQQALTVPVFRLCESASEILLLNELMLLTNAYPCSYQRHHLLARDYGKPFWLGFSLRIYPQYKLRLRATNGAAQRNFRPDFLLLLIPPKYPPNIVYPRDFLTDATAKLVLEVDGHDYHERTKEQAEYDRSRDRAFTNSGFTVFRFTGREIYRDVRNKSLEVLHFLNSACSRFPSPRCADDCPY